MTDGLLRRTFDFYVAILGPLTIVEGYLKSEGIIRGVHLALFLKSRQTTDY